MATLAHEIVTDYVVFWPLQPLKGQVASLHVIEFGQCLADLQANLRADLQADLKADLQTCGLIARMESVLLNTNLKSTFCQCFDSSWYQSEGEKVTITKIYSHEGPTLARIAFPFPCLLCHSGTPIVPSKGGLHGQTLAKPVGVVSWWLDHLNTNKSSSCKLTNL